MARNLKMASEAAIIIALPAFGSVWERPAPLRGARIAFTFQNPLANGVSQLFQRHRRPGDLAAAEAGRGRHRRASKRAAGGGP